MEAEYRGKLMGMDGWEACVICRPSNGHWYQTTAPLSQIRPAK